MSRGWCLVARKSFKELIKNTFTEIGSSVHHTLRPPSPPPGKPSPLLEVSHAIPSLLRVDSTPPLQLTTIVASSLQSWLIAVPVPFQVWPPQQVVQVVLPMKGYNPAAGSTRWGCEWAKGWLLHSLELGLLICKHQEVWKLPPEGAFHDSWGLVCLVWGLSRLHK